MVLRWTNKFPLCPKWGPALHSADSSTLLPADRGLLDINFSDLDSNPAIVRQTWRSEIGNASSPGCSTLRWSSQWIFTSTSTSCWHWRQHLILPSQKQQTIGLTHELNYPGWKRFAPYGSGCCSAFVCGKERLYGVTFEYNVVNDLVIVRMIYDLLSVGLPCSVFVCVFPRERECI